MVVWFIGNVVCCTADCEAEEEVMGVIYSIVVPAIVSLAVSIWFGRKIIDKAVEVMEKMDNDNQEINQDMREAVLSEIRKLRDIR